MGLGEFTLLLQIRITSRIHAGYRLVASRRVVEGCGRKVLTGLDSVQH